MSLNPTTQLTIGFVCVSGLMLFLWMIQRPTSPFIPWFPKRDVAARQ